VLKLTLLDDVTRIKAFGLPDASAPLIFALALSPAIDFLPISWNFLSYFRFF
jgi:hypothetical protein